MGVEPVCVLFLPIFAIKDNKAKQILRKKNYVNTPILNGTTRSYIIFNMLIFQFNENYRQVLNTINREKNYSEHFINFCLVRVKLTIK